MHNHGRTGAIAAAVFAALAIVAPGTALAGHDLQIYKAEAQLDLASDDGAVDVSCQAGDHVLDGMWRVDHADEDEYVAPRDLIAGAVDVLAAYPKDDNTYTFSFNKNAIGRVQVKAWVTCLGDKTQGGSHTHSFNTGFVKHDGTSTAPANNTFDSESKTVTAPAASTAPVVTTFDTANVQTAVGPPAVFSDYSCPANTVLVSPGFKSELYKDNTAAPVDASPGVMRVFRDNYSTSAGTVDPRRWTWSFEDSGMPQGYSHKTTVYWRCLKIKVPAGSYDKHKLVAKAKTKTFSPNATSESEGQLTCGDQYKAPTAGFSIPTNGSDVRTSDRVNETGLLPYNLTNFPNSTAFNDIYFLGMDPRIKQRAYRFVNRGTHAGPVTFSALCINYRTT